ncbi:unnamed protein product [Cladocopium goreaui]|uniref:Uncharacterized protein n=1 Tax=Cladocopium goreaui TaxID=2562237 RepID=A0A9P1CWR7_9DINO|nr:unnamed protein product [Cladocopium goreaui]|mmetsp:Transcript_58996/g.129296  ORF Transcript_58996/g.129296 Transcript_58996/m.129296 type:complete len:384 (+) Transcript_58996:58-1209(+)
MATENMRALPPRPLDELPADHCMLRSRSFSFLPRKYRAAVTLPPMRPHVPIIRRSVLRSKAQNRRSMKPKQDPAQPVPGCYGDFCHTEFKYPQILQDIETGTDAWTRQGRQLCLRHAMVEGKELDTLMKPEELAACLQDNDSDADASPSKVATSVVTAGTAKVKRKEGLMDLPASQVLEARSHPGLCQWLESLDWRINPEDATLLLAAAAHLASDEAAPVPRNMSLRMDVTVPGMRYRLRPLKVCRTCFNTYQVISQVITLVRHQRKDLWAKAELERLKRHDEKEKELAQDAYIQRVIGDPEERAARAAQMGRCPPPPCLPRESLIFDHEVTQWMRDIPDSPSTSEMMKNLWRKAEEPHSEELLEAPPSSPEPNRRRRAVLGL